MKLNQESANFRVMGPDETDSNRLSAIFEVTDRTSMAEILPNDVHVSRDGRVMEVLSEHMCQGWLEGYLLTGRHGFFSCYVSCQPSTRHYVLLSRHTGRSHRASRRSGSCRALQERVMPFHAATYRIDQGDSPRTASVSPARPASAGRCFVQTRSTARPLNYCHDLNDPTRSPSARYL